MSVPSVTYHSASSITSLIAQAEPGLIRPLTFQPPHPVTSTLNMARRYLDVVMNYDYDIPPKAQDVSHWWRPYYEYREFHVAVYALYPMSSEDNSLFIRDELTVSETAQRLLGRPRNWRCPSGRLEDIVREHVTMCNARLNELDEAEDDSEDDQGAWNRKPVVSRVEAVLVTPSSIRSGVRQCPALFYNNNHTSSIPLPSSSSPPTPTARMMLRS